MPTTVRVDIVVIGSEHYVEVQAASADEGQSETLGPFYSWDEAKLVADDLKAMLLSTPGSTEILAGRH